MVRLGEAGFERLLEAMAGAVVVADSAGVIRFVNRQTEVLFGYDGADLVGQPVETLVPEPLRQPHRAHRAAFVAHPETRFMGSGLQLSGRRRDGSPFPADIILCSVDTEDGPLVIAAVYDMTDLHKSLYDMADRKMADRLAAIVESSNDAIISSTLDGVITSWNPAAEKMLGISRREAVGKSLMLLVTSDGVEEIALILAQVRAGQPTQPHESVRVREDGTKVLLSLTISPVKDAAGVIIGASAIVRDSAQQREAKHETAD